MAHTTDFGATTASIPVAPAGSGHSASRVAFAFADYGFFRDSDDNLLVKFMNEQITGTFETFGFSKLSNSVSGVQNRGGKAIVTFGGATFSWSSTIKTTSQASAFSSNVVTFASLHRLDGVEFSHIDPLGSPDTFTDIISSIRDLNTTMEVSYTIPGNGPFLSPWRDAIQSNNASLSLVQVMAYDTYQLTYNVQNDIDELVKLGISKSKIVIVMMPGCHDEPFAFTSVQDVSNTAGIVRRQGLAGINLWSANRDTNHRTQQTSCLFQTGLPDGFFINYTSAQLGS